MGEALRGDAGGGGAGRRPARGLTAALARSLPRSLARSLRAGLLAAAALVGCGGQDGPRLPDAPPPSGGERRATLDSAPAGAVRLEAGRFSVIAFPGDVPLARTLLAAATARDSFPGLPRPRRAVLVAIAPDARRFREWGGSAAPEWGAALAFPRSHRIIMQGRAAGSDAGDPVAVFRHELAHLALHEHMGELPPRWFDEGYAGFAAGEWGREEVLAASIGLLVNGLPSLDSLESGFYAGARRAEQSYALAYRAVADLDALDPARGLALFFRYWKESGKFDVAVRQAYGVTGPQFEELWQQRTRSRYGALALLANLSVATVFFMVLFLPLYLARRRRDRARLEAMRAADEAAEREEREGALAALLGETPPGSAVAPERRSDALD